MRIASYNVENLFSRAKALNQETWSEGRPVLEKFKALSELLEEPVYTPAIKDKILELIAELGLTKSDTGPMVILRRNRGSLLKRPKNGPVEVVASGRTDWIGWVELREEPINETAILNTAQVVSDLKANIFAVVEAEDRTALKEFNRDILPAVGGAPFDQIMLIDGNDERGIDVGLMTSSGYRIGNMRSHVHDKAPGQEDWLFSRDCPEFEVTTPGGEVIWVLVNHLKSKGYGIPAQSNARRKAQAKKVAKIYKELRNKGIKHVAICGDLNDTPESDPLEPLLSGTDLKDCSVHPAFDDGGFPGTYGGATKSNKLDYILLSPALFGAMTGGGYFRKGAWPGVRPKKWEVYESLVKPVHAGSDHHAVFADFNL